MTIYKYPDPRHFAFLLGGLFLFLCSIKSLDPTDFYTYVPIFSGSLVLALYGIYISCNYLLWPILIVTGFLTTVSGIVLIPSAPFVFIPNVMSNWDECKEFFDEKKYNSSEYDNPAAAIISNSIACYIRNSIQVVYVVPFLTTPVFYCLFVLFKNSQLRIKNEKKPELPVFEEEEFDIYWIDLSWIDFISFVSLLILLFAYITRCVALFLWPASFTAIQCSEISLNAGAVGFCFALCFFGHKNLSLKAIILYFLFKAATNVVQSFGSVLSKSVSANKCQRAICCHALNEMNATYYDVTFTRFFSLEVMMETNSTDLAAASIAATSCYEANRASDLFDFIHPFGAALLFLFSVLYLDEIVEKPIWKTTKKIIQSAI